MKTNRKSHTGFQLYRFRLPWTTVMHHLTAAGCVEVNVDKPTLSEEIGSLGSIYFSDVGSLHKNIGFFLHKFVWW